MTHCMDYPQTMYTFGMFEGTQIICYTFHRIFILSLYYLIYYGMHIMCDDTSYLLLNTMT